MTPHSRPPFQFSLAALLGLMLVLAACLALLKRTGALEWGRGALHYFWPLLGPFAAFFVVYAIAWAVFFRGWRRTGICLVLLAMVVFLAGLLLMGRFYPFLIAP